jgi:hypothetical protein
MENNKMYLTTTEAKAKGLGSVQEQLDRYNSALPGKCIVRFGECAATYYTRYHAEQFARALTLNGTPNQIEEVN